MADEPTPRHRFLIVMGVSGCGKSTIGAQLAQQLGWTFYDADDYHPTSNIDKMANGIPLTDEDRWPWLDRLNALMQEHQARDEAVVIACSALKQCYRERLAKGLPDIGFVYLRGSYELIRDRMQARNHFFRPELLQSQFEALEEPHDGIDIDIEQPPEAIVKKLRQRC